MEEYCWISRPIPVAKMRSNIIGKVLLTAMTWFELSTGLGPSLEVSGVELHQRYLEIRTKLGFGDTPMRIPLKADVDPTDFPALLPLINLVERRIEGGEDRFQYKLIGTRNRDAAGKNIKGQYLRDSVKPEYHSRIRGNYVQCMKSRKPVFDFFWVPHEHRGHITSERMYYPLSGNGRDIASFLVLHGYEDVGLSSYKGEQLGSLMNGQLFPYSPSLDKELGDCSWLIQ